MLRIILTLICSGKMSEIVPLESFIRQSNGDDSEILIAELSRTDSLFKLEDTRDLVFAMLHYRFHLLTEILFLPIHLLQYGCQCQIMTDASLGVAKDSLDESCVGWHQCRTCIKMSTELMTQDQICDPMHSMYPIGVNITDQSLSCELAENACQQTTCECDLNLVNNFMKNLDSFKPERVAHKYDHRKECRNKKNKAGKPKQEIQHFNIQDVNYEAAVDDVYVSKNSELISRIETMESDTIAEPERNRPIQPAVASSSAYQAPMTMTYQPAVNYAEPARQVNSNPKLSFNHNSGSYDICCGTFPNVRPYSSNGGKRKCCGSTVYDWKKRECCPHGISPVGTC